MNASTVTKTNRAYGLVRRSKPYYHTTGGGGKEEQQQEQEQEQEEGRRRNGPAELRLSKRGQSRQAKCSCRGARPGCRGNTGGGRGGVSGTVRQPTWTPQASQITDLRINAGQKVYDRYTKNSAVQHQSGNPRICRCHPQWPLRQAPPAPVLPERYADSMRDPIRPVHWFHRLVALCDGPAGTDATAGSGATPDNVLACGRC